MKTFEEALNKAIDNAPFTPGLEDGSYKEGFVDGLEHAQELLDIHKGRAIIDIITDVLNWLNQNPLEWEYGGDVDDIIDKYLKSKRRLAKDIEREVVTDDPQLINEILTKYHEWASNILAMRFAKWEEEEGDFDKTKARIRKEFIEFLNKQNKP